MGDIELYIHIPFCIRKCNYCDFLSFPAGDEEQKKYVEALLEEIRITGNMAEDVKVRSIFIGGGTPSILHPSLMERILQAVFHTFSVRDDAEISMEANPGTLTHEKLLSYYNMGINRLSIGLQSTEDSCLKKLGRIHTFAQFKDNYELARQIGYDNINIDLMSALPDQTLSSYVDTLETVLAMKPEHISAYSLILEEGTPFYDDDQLIDSLPDEDTERKMYEITKEILGKHGYERYEISNYALPGRQCLHNLGYWDNVAYLGLGLGASSYWNAARYSNESSLARYIESPYKPPEERKDYHVLTKEEQMEEYMFLGLRKCAGVSLSRFRREFGCSMEEVYGSVIRKYQGMGLLSVCGDRLSLTDAGIDVSNHIFSDFLFD